MAGSPTRWAVRADPVDAEHQPGQRELRDRARIRSRHRRLGRDPLWFTSLFSQHTLDLLELGLGGPLTADRLQEAIGYDLAVTDVTPKLFLPTLSGLTQGPGFPNLSCLGLLSDRVLGAGIFTPTKHNDTRRSGEHQSFR